MNTYFLGVYTVRGNAPNIFIEYPRLALAFFRIPDAFREMVFGTRGVPFERTEPRGAAIVLTDKHSVLDIANYELKVAGVLALDEQAILRERKEFSSEKSLEEISRFYDAQPFRPMQDVCLGYAARYEHRYLIPDLVHEKKEYVFRL
jgi:hypothetical protein